VGTQRELPPRLTHCRHLLVLHLDQSTSSPAAALRHRLLVRGDVEGDEEEEVRRQDADTGDGGEFLTGALAGIGQPWPVGVGEVGPGSKVDKA
jgi:hypothetical protein